MNGQAIRRSWSDEAHDMSSIVWSIPALLMLVSLGLQIAAQSEHRHGQRVVAGGAPMVWMEETGGAI
jgi:hypothetical protein